MLPLASGPLWCYCLHLKHFPLLSIWITQASVRTFASSWMSSVISEDQVCAPTFSHLLEALSTREPNTTGQGPALTSPPVTQRCLPRQPPNVKRVASSARDHTAFGAGDTGGWRSVLPTELRSSTKIISSRMWCGVRFMTLDMVRNKALNSSLWKQITTLAVGRSAG